MRRITTSLIALVCALAAASPAAAQSAERVASDAANPPAAREIDAAAWHRVVTAHFALFGDVPARTLRALAVDLEALESLLAGLNPDQSVRSPRVQVIVFASDEAFSRYAPFTVEDEPARVSGFFLSHPHGDFVVASAAAEADVRRVLYHEALHHFVRHHLPEAPLWLNEGLAEFYSTLEVERDRAWLGRQVVEHVSRLQRAPRRPLADLLAIESAPDAPADTVHDGAFYAESWALVHHLLTAEEGGRAAVARYAGRLRAGDDPPAAFTEEFGDLMALDRRIDAALRRAPREPLELPVRNRVRYEELQAPSVAPADLDHRLGWLLSHHSPARAADARAHFEAALRLDPDHAGAITGIGWLAELAGDDDAARQHYAHARELAPRDPLPPFLEAQALMRAAGEPSGAQRRSPEAAAMLEAARAGFRASLALEPELAEAWAGLGAAWLADPVPGAAGLDALERAYRRLPTRIDVLYNLTLLEARVGSPERAAAHYQRLEQRAEPELVESAREAMLRLQGARLP